LWFGKGWTVVKMIRSLPGSSREVSAGSRLKLETTVLPLRSV